LIKSVVARGLCGAFFSRPAKSRKPSVHHPKKPVSRLGGAMKTHLSSEQLKLINKRCAAETGGFWEGVIMEFGGYEIQTEPEDRQTRKYCWDTAIGLQKSDGLTVSDRLLEIAEANILGRITLTEAERLVKEYYSVRAEMSDAEDRKKEADHSALRITQILEENTFSLAPPVLTSINRRIFGDVFPFAGKFRTANLSKREWMLGGKSVVYTVFSDIKQTLDFDFSEERKIDYSKLDPRQKAERTAKFISGLWQIHPFWEGNTRTISVFTIQRLRFFGFDVTNDIFKDNAWYFRNCLVRANYEDTKLDIQPDLGYLNRFFARLLFGDENKLSNRELLLAPQDLPASPAADPSFPDGPTAGADPDSGHSLDPKL
jgi:fido (protein-threonine AMPylation protein)